MGPAATVVMGVEEVALAKAKNHAELAAGNGAGGGGVARRSVSKDE